MTNPTKITTLETLSDLAISTLGTWSAGPARIVASYHDETSIRIDVSGSSRVLTEREWLQMWDDIRDAGYTRAA